MDVSGRRRGIVSPRAHMSADYEIIEHTADVGIRAWAESLESLFLQTTLGLLDIAGAWRPGSEGTEVPIAVEAPDLGGLLVDWLGEVLYLQEARDALIGDVVVDLVGEGRASGRITLAPREGESVEGTAVKAITYHQLSVGPAGGGFEARVFVDV